MAKQTPKPLWGFGWAGWCLLSVAVTLAAMLVAGVDVRFWILSRITWNLGIGATMWFVATFLDGHAIYDFPFLYTSGTIAPTMRFSIATMCCTLVALQIHPRRIGVARTLCLVALAVIIPGLSMTLMHRMSMLFNSSRAARTFNPGAFVMAMTAFTLVWATVSTLAVTWASRSWRLGLVIAGIQSLGSWLTIEVQRALPGAAMAPLLFRVNDSAWWYIWLSRLWNPLMFAVMLTWAIHARRRTFPTHCCSSCGYDLRGLSGTCPECGAPPRGASLPPSPTA